MLRYEYGLNDSPHPALVHEEDYGLVTYDWAKGCYVCEECGERFSRKEADAAIETL